MNCKEVQYLHYDFVGNIVLDSATIVEILKVTSMFFYVTNLLSRKARVQNAMFTFAPSVYLWAPK